MGAAYPALFPPYKRGALTVSIVTRRLGSITAGASLLILASESKHVTGYHSDQVSRHVDGRCVLGDRHGLLLLRVGLDRAVEVRVVADHLDRHSVQSRGVQLRGDRSLPRRPIGLI